MTFKMKNMAYWKAKNTTSPVKQNGDDEYQKSWKGDEGPKESLKAFQKDLADAEARGDKEMIKMIKMDINSAKKEIAAEKFLHNKLQKKPD